jgi:CheY-like chemotaxis protein
VSFPCPTCRRAVAGSPDPDRPGAFRCDQCGTPFPTDAVLGRVAVRRVRPEDLPEGPVVLGGALIDEAEPVPDAAEDIMGGLVMPTKPLYGCILVLDDSALQRAIIRDGLLQQGLAEQVLCAELGPEFITTATQAFIAEANVDLAILDLELPGLGGFAAAVALRAIEKGFRRPPTPILFFSGRALDDAAKRTLKTVEMATFLSKDAAQGPEQGFARLADALRILRRGTAA